MLFKKNYSVRLLLYRLLYCILTSSDLFIKYTFHNTPFQYVEIARYRLGI